MLWYALTFISCCNCGIDGIAQIVSPLMSLWEHTTNYHSPVFFLFLSLLPLLSLSCVIRATYNIELQPFMNYFPHVDIHELLTPNLLHQLIKGAFKDHIVSWIITYIKVKHPE